MSSKITLQEYIETRNYRKKLSSHSKSTRKLKKFNGRAQGLNSNAIERVQIGQQSKPQKNLDSESETLENNSRLSKLQQIEQNSHSFSKIRQKVEEIKCFLLSHIRQDRLFISISKRFTELQLLCRSEIVEAYRFQLFNYQEGMKKIATKQKEGFLSQIDELLTQSKLQESELKKSLTNSKVNSNSSRRQVPQSETAIQLQSVNSLPENSNQEESKGLESLKGSQIKIWHTRSLKDPKFSSQAENKTHQQTLVGKNELNRNSAVHSIIKEPNTKEASSQWKLKKSSSGESVFKSVKFLE